MLVRATPARMKCPVRHTVKVICRRVRERTIEKTLSVERSETPPNHLGLDFHIYIYVYIRTYVSNTRARVSDLR